MKRLYFLPSLALLSVGIFAFQTSTSTGIIKKYHKSVHLQSSGGQSGLTGAPGEGVNNNCTQCHSGSVLNGDSQNEFTVLDGSFTPVTSYIPGASYTVTLQLASNPAKKGFSSTVLDDGTNSMAGSLTGSGVGGTQDFPNGGVTRDYVSHTSGSNTSANIIWSWNWIAPATNVGNVTFYVASNAANNNGATTGDQIFLSQHTLNGTVGISELNGNDFLFNAGYSDVGNKVTLNFTSLIADYMFFNLVDLNGKSVFTSDMTKSVIGKNKNNVSLPAEIENGMYVVHFFVGNRAMSAKIMIQK